MNRTTKTIWERERSRGPLLVGLPDGTPYMGAVCFVIEDGHPIECYRISQPPTLGKLYEYNEAHGTYEYGMTVSYDEDCDPRGCFEPDEQVKPWRVYGKAYKYAPYTKGMNAYTEGLLLAMAAAGVSDPDQLPKETEKHVRNRRQQRAGDKSADRGPAEGGVS